MVVWSVCVRASPTASGILHACGTIDGAVDRIRASGPHCLIGELRTFRVPIFVKRNPTRRRIRGPQRHAGGPQPIPRVAGRISDKRNAIPARPTARPTQAAQSQVAGCGTSNPNAPSGRGRSGRSSEAGLRQAVRFLPPLPSNAREHGGCRRGGTPDTKKPRRSVASCAAPGRGLRLSRKCR